MGIKIFFRNNVNKNNFRQIVTEIPLKTNVDEAVLCSGFFQEGKGQYYASIENSFCRTLAQKNIRITTIGVHNWAWKKDYFDFVHNLRLAGVHVTGLYKPNFHWHAKILLYKYMGTYVCGIIGSSNLTRNAFSLSSPFNYEADILLYNSNILPKHTIDSIISENINPEDVVDGIYSVENNGNMTIEERLSSIEEKLLDEEYTEI